MDATAWTIIGAMAAAITAMGGFIGKLYCDLLRLNRKLMACQESRMTMAEQHHREVLALKDMVRSRKNGDGNARD